jgi:hypothetical protein
MRKLLIAEDHGCLETKCSQNTGWAGMYRTKLAKMAWLSFLGKITGRAVLSDGRHVVDIQVLPERSVGYPVVAFRLPL